MSQKASAQINEAASSHTKRRIDVPAGETSPYFSGSGFTPFLYRKASCACGGGCPSCASASSGLNVSRPGDAAEVEADRIADTVMRMADDSPVSVGASSAPHSIHRKCSACDDDEIIQRKAGHSAGFPGGPGLSSLVRDATISGGRPLDRAARRFFEPRFAYDFSGVRIHTGGPANAAARAVDASAYTLGSDIVFAPGMYSPGSPAGDRLLAHELAHVVQQDTGAINRKKLHRAPAITGGKIDVTKSCDGKAPAPKGPAAQDASGLEIKPSKNGGPCACLLVVHNKERNARKTAELMHENCSYNLATVEADTGTRCIKLPSHNAKDEFDPNEFFDPDIVKQCLDDESACKAYLKDKTMAESTDPAVIDRYVQVSYFLKVKDCSKSFSLPVIALHNNAINDTAEYRKQKKAGAKTSELKMDIEKEDFTKGTDDKKLEPMIKKLVDNFGDAARKEMVPAGKTNIIRWCVSQELSSCHIGDPDRPDHVIWVTNQKDFNDLKTKNLNVALQNDPARLKPESRTDLSTLFLSLKTLMETKLAPEIAKLEKEALAIQTNIDTKKVEKAVIDFGAVFNPSLGASIRSSVIQGIINQLGSDLKLKQADVAALKLEFAKYQDLHFINIEGPGYSIADRTDDERIESYDIIVEALRTIGLHCCAGKEKDAEDKVRQGLKLAPPPPAKKAKP